MVALMTYFIPSYFATVNFEIGFSSEHFSDFIFDPYFN
jgi:hypothetical protein